MKLHDGIYTAGNGPRLFTAVKGNCSWWFAIDFSGAMSRYKEGGRGFLEGVDRNDVSSLAIPDEFFQ